MRQEARTFLAKNPRGQAFGEQGCETQSKDARSRRDSFGRDARYKAEGNLCSAKEQKVEQGSCRAAGRQECPARKLFFARFLAP